MNDKNGKSNTDDPKKQQQNNKGVKRHRADRQFAMSPRGVGTRKTLETQLDAEKSAVRSGPSGRVVPLDLRRLPLGTTWSTTTFVTRHSKAPADAGRCLLPSSTTTIRPFSNIQNYVSTPISNAANPHLQHLAPTTPTTATVTGMQPVIGDFPSFVETETSTPAWLSRGTDHATGSTHTIDASKTTEGESHVGSRKLTPTKTISATTEIRKSVARSRVEPKTPVITTAAKSTENKCPDEAAEKVSCQRELEASGCTVNAEPRRSAQIGSTRVEFEPQEYPKTTKGLYGLSTAKQRLSLAERKAKLRADFFAKTDREAHGLAYIKQLIGVRVPPTVLLSSCESTQSSLGLVAQRIQDLNKKKEEVKSAPHKEVLRRPAVSPKLLDRVKIFDTVTLSRSMIGNTTELLSLKPAMMEHRNSPLSDEGCNLGQSPYSSDNEDNESTNTTIERIAKRKDKVARSASSDSALGLEVDEAMDTTPSVPPTGPQPRRMTLTVTDLPLRPALLPLAEPTALPDASTPLADIPQNMPAPTVVPSKVLIEERVVELPEANCALPCSRRESSQSCLSDYPNSECSGVRYVRTPSVVVSDYSDEVLCGITLEEIEYFRAQRMRRRCSSLDTGTEKDGDNQSDVSASSSCSNLYYCGSTISALDGNECFVNGVRLTLERKTSDCSNCSVSADEDGGYTIREEQTEDLSNSAQQINKDLSDLLAAQHLSAVQQQQRNAAAKKVGLLAPLSGPTMGKASYEP